MSTWGGEVPNSDSEEEDRATTALQKMLEDQDSDDDVSLNAESSASDQEEEEEEPDGDMDMGGDSMQEDKMEKLIGVAEQGSDQKEDQEQEEEEQEQSQEEEEEEEDMTIVVNELKPGDFICVTENLMLASKNWSLAEVKENVNHQGGYKRVVYWKKDKKNLVQPPPENARVRLVYTGNIMCKLTAPTPKNSRWFQLSENDLKRINNLLKVDIISVSLKFKFYLSKSWYFMLKFG